MRQNVKKQTVRLTAEEYAHLKSTAAEANMSMESLIRQLIMGAQLRPRPPGEYTALLRELAAIGNNINQIAYWANTQKGISSSQVDDTVALVHRAWQLVKETL